jgi:hypothetical protein
MVCARHRCLIVVLDDELKANNRTAADTSHYLLAVEYRFDAAARRSWPDEAFVFHLEVAEQGTCQRVKVDRGSEIKTLTRNKRILETFSNNVKLLNPPTEVSERAPVKQVCEAEPRPERMCT